MKTMPLTVRSCPVDVHAALEEAARAAGRSKTQEAIRWLQTQARARQPERQSEAELLQRIAALKFRVKLTPAEVKAAREDGRA